MANTTISPNMMMPIPVVSVDPGPDWATNINSCLSIIDGHNHSLGTGVQITPSGLNINADLTIQDNNLTNVRTIRFFPQSAALSGGSDIGCLYEAGVDLYYNDGSGNQIRITQSGSVAGSAGTITGLPSGTASAAYSGGTFVFQSATSTAATIDAGSYIFRNLTASSNGVTVSPVNSLGSNYSLFLPTLPGSTSIMQLDNAGNITAALAVDNSTLQNTGTVLKVKSGGITNTQIATGFGLNPTGAIIAFGGSSAPSGYLLCDGTSYLQSAYPTLFAAIGTAYGSADGTHFNVPDLRGQFLRGVTGSSANDPDASSRTANNTGGNTGNNIGSQQSYQIQSHSHSVTANAVAGGSTGSSNNWCSGGTPEGSGTVGTSGTGGNETRPINVYVNFIIKT
jgi:microcystin-dependent protein